MKQTTVLKDLLSFQGEWRSYQKRVLDHADNYLKDGFTSWQPPASEKPPWESN